jgi:hypothetical protein
MPTTTTTTTPALNRRALLSRTLAGAAIGAAAALPAAALPDVADPLPALLARRTAIVAWINETGADSEHPIYPELNAIEARLFGAIATSRDGLVSQLRFLSEFMEDFYFDDHCDCLVANVIRGIEHLPAGVAA